MKYYSELLDKKFDTKQELVEEEADYEIKRARKEELEKTYRARLEAARQKFVKAAEEYGKIVMERQPYPFSLDELVELLFT